MKQKKDIWQEFCYDLIEARKNDVLEDKYQDIVESNLRQLGWSKVQGEICPKERINVGSHNQVEPDITIKTNGIPVFVIELKRPNNSITLRQEQQLLSYMRLCKTLLGLYIGSDIRLFYDTNEDVPTMVWKTEIDLNAENGEEFIDFFLYETFNQQRLENICRTKAVTIKTDKTIKEFQYDLSIDSNSTIRKVVFEYLVSLKGCNKELVNATLSKLTFATKEAETLHTNPSVPVHSSGTIWVKNVTYNKSKRDNSKYSIDGGHVFLGKGRIVREIVACFIKQHPNLTFEQLSQIFPDNLQGSYGVLRTMSDIASSSQNKKDLMSRYTMSSEKSILTSSDGIKFVVSNQWGPYNFINFLDHIKGMGWIVTNISKKP